MAHDLVLQVHRGDPFAAALDHVLGAVHDADIAIHIYGRDIAGAQPAVGELVYIVIPAMIVRPSDPGAAYLQLAAGCAVAGHLPALVVYDAVLDQRRSDAHLRTALILLLHWQPKQVAAHTADGAQGRHLGHA